MSSPIVTLPVTVTSGLPYFPASRFSGLKVDLKRTSSFDNTISRAASGREVGVSWREMPIITLDLSWDFLDANPDTTPPSDDGSAVYTELDWLTGFFEQQHGDLLPFYLRVADLPGQPDTASQVQGQQIGVGDGATVNFQLCRTVGPYIEPMQMVDPAFTPVIYDNGVQLTSGYTILPGGIVQFASAPANTHIISADFNWLYLCRFDSGEMDVDQFSQLAYECQSLKLRTVIQ